MVVSFSFWYMYLEEFGYAWCCILRVCQDIVVSLLSWVVNHVTLSKNRSRVLLLRINFLIPFQNFLPLVVLRWPLSFHWCNILFCFLLTVGIENIFIYIWSGILTLCVNSGQGIDQTYGWWTRSISWTTAAGFCLPARSAAWR